MDQIRPFFNVLDSQTKYFIVNSENLPEDY
jgi:hypothetical protein